MRKAGYDLVVSSSNTNLDLELQTVERLLSQQVDGLILSRVQYKKATRLLKEAQGEGIHCVIAGPPAESIPYDSATIDLEEATTRMMEHLFALGHRKFGFIWGAPFYQGIGGRYEIFCSMLKKRKLSMNPKWIIHCGVKLQDGYQAGRQLLALKDRPTAVFVLNDLLSIGVLRAAVDLKLKVPSDVSIVGVDNIEFSAFQNPSLTTIGQPIEKYAEALTSLVLEGLVRKKTHRAKRIVLKAEAIFRESTGAPLTP